MSLPKRAMVLICAVVAAGAACAATQLPQLGTWSIGDLAALASVAAMTLIGERFALQFRFGEQTKNVTMTEAAFAAALLLGVRSSVLTLGVVAGVIAAHAVRRTHPVKAAFNVGSFAAAVTAMELAFHAVRPAGSVVAVMAAAACFFAVNASTVVGVIATVERRSFLSVFAPISPVELAQAGGNAAVGIVAASVLQASAGAAPVAVLAGVLCLAGYRVLSARPAGVLAG